MLIFLESFDGIFPANLGQKGWNGGGTLSTAFPRTGTNGYFASNSNQRVLKGVPAAMEDDTFIAGVAVYLPQIVDSGYGFLRFLSDGGATVHVDLVILPTGAIKVVRNSGGILAQTGAGVVTANAHHYIEAKVKLHDTTGTVDVRVNGVSVISATGLDTKNNGTKTVFDSISIGGFDSFSNAGMYLDDVYLANKAGSVNNTFLGECRVRCILPSGNGNSNQWVGSDGNSVNNYQLVDETPPDTADFVGAANTGDKDTYTFADLPDTSGTVAGIYLSALAMKTDAGSRTLALVTRHSGTDYDSADLALPTVAPAYVAQVQDTNPGTGVAWLRSEVNAAEFGVKARP